MRKFLRKIIFTLVVLLILVLLIAWATIDRLAKTGIEQGGRYAMGVDTTVDDVSVSLLKGQMTIDGLEIGNPEGYKTPHLMKSGHWELSVRFASLMTDTVEMPRLELDGLDLNIEQKLGKSNIKEVMDNMKRLRKEKEKEEKPGKKLRIETVRIRNVTAHVQVLPGSKPVLVKVDEIELKDVTPENSKGIVISELFQRLMAAVLAGVIDKAKDVPGIPSGFLNDLSKDVAGLAESLGEDAAKLIKQAGSDVGKRIKETIPKPVQDLPKNVGDKLKDILGK